MDKFVKGENEMWKNVSEETHLNKISRSRVLDLLSTYSIREEFHKIGSRQH